MKVSIIVPLYNEDKTVIKILSAVQNEIKKLNEYSFEVIVINDGSNDNSFKIMNTFKRKTNNDIHIFRNETALGLQRCANHVIEKSRGEYIIRLDADDYFDENALLVLSNYLDKNPDIALVFPNYIYINEEGEILDVEQRRKTTTS